ncbi:MAG TPA: alpha/beta hydrolase [Candidatus Limnocylindrales bacterium]
MTPIPPLPPVPPSLASTHDRARLPDRDGWAADESGVRIHWEVYGEGEPTIVLLPSTPIVHSRQWKGQVPYLARHFRVITYDGRGNGRSDRPTEPAAYDGSRIVGDIGRVLDATGTGHAVLVGLCGDGVWPAFRFAAASPDRVEGIVAFAVGVPRLAPPHPWRVQWSFEDELPTDEGWAKVNAHYWRRDYAGFARFFFAAITTEPHSTKVIEDAAAWAVEGSVDAMLADAATGFDLDRDGVEAVVRAVRSPILVVHGSEDHCQPPVRARILAELTGATLVEVEGADHMIPGRHPVLANLLIRDFVRSLRRPTP